MIESISEFQLYSKMKEKGKIILISSISAIVLILIIGGILFFALSGPQQLAKTEQTTESGEAVTTSYTCLGLCQLRSSTSLVPQTVMFSASEFTSGTSFPKTYNLGDSILLYSRVSCSDSGPYKLGTHNAVMHIYLTNKDTGEKSTITLSVPNAPNNVYFYASTNIAASKIGSWTAYDDVKCYQGTTQTNLVSQADYSGLTRTFSVQSGTITCPEPKLVRSSISVSSSSYTSVYGINCEEWSTYSGSTCTGSPEYKNCQTTCSSGAFCDTTYSSSTCSGKVSCLVKPIESCTDGIMNQDETGVDCGGSCTSCTNTIDDTTGTSGSTGTNTNTNTGTNTGGTTGTTIPGFVIKDGKCSAVSDKAEYVTKTACDSALALQNKPNYVALVLIWIGVILVLGLIITTIVILIRRR